ncbi:MAG: fumarylacetoacetate hydrolase family protein [Xanthomonadales bacterium]|nr:fumarylacetoacetate hydrolase family protein [Xanthomonadales bacterium]
MDRELLFEHATGSLLTVSGTARLFPVHRVYCVGRNYSAHAREMGHSGREAPFFFAKPPDAPTQRATVAFPPVTADLHHEVELVAALGEGGHNIPETDALRHVFGYAVGVDLTRRDLQAEAKKQGRPWDVAKGFDGSAPMSVIHPAAEVGHPASGRIELAVDGETRQRGDLADMIWSVAGIIAELSRYFELRAGDLVFTGTPEGVGPLVPEATVVCSIAGVAEHRFSLGARL